MNYYIYDIVVINILLKLNFRDDQYELPFQKFFKYTCVTLKKKKKYNVIIFSFNDIFLRLENLITSYF